MENWQQNFILLFSLFSLAGFLLGLKQSIQGKSFENAGIFHIISAFVLGDAVVFGLFWFAASLVTYLLKDWTLFCLFFTLFWLIRSLGETQYWMLQQFSKINRNPPENFWFYKYFKNDSVWFVWQIYWQCHATVWAVLSIYFATKWIQVLL